MSQRAVPVSIAATAITKIPTVSDRTSLSASGSLLSKPTASGQSICGLLLTARCPSACWQLVPQVVVPPNKLPSHQVFSDSSRVPSSARRCAFVFRAHIEVQLQLFPCHSSHVRLQQSYHTVFLCCKPPLNRSFDIERVHKNSGSRARPSKPAARLCCSWHR